MEFMLVIIVEPAALSDKSSRYVFSGPHEAHPKAWFYEGIRKPQHQGPNRSSLHSRHIAYRRSWRCFARCKVLREWYCIEGYRSRLIEAYVINAHDSNLQPFGLLHEMAIHGAHLFSNALATVLVPTVIFAESFSDDDGSQDTADAVITAVAWAVSSTVACCNRLRDQ